MCRHGAPTLQSRVEPECSGVFLRPQSLLLVRRVPSDPRHSALSSASPLLFRFALLLAAQLAVRFGSFHRRCHRTIAAAVAAAVAAADVAAVVLSIVSIVVFVATATVILSTIGIVTAKVVTVDLAYESVDWCSLKEFNMNWRHKELKSEKFHKKGF